MPKLPSIFIISDIHRDTGPFEWPEAARAADLILVAGDLSNGQFDIKFLCEPGKPLVFVPGNHDFWSKDGRDMVDMYRDMKRAAAGTNVHVLWDEEVQIDGVRILGTPLWTDFGKGNEELMAAAFAHSRDYQYINAKSWYDSPENRDLQEQRGPMYDKMRGWSNLPSVIESGAFTPLVAYSLHQKSLAFLKSKLEESFEGPTILVTHMAPSYECLRQSGTISEHYLDPRHWHRVGRDNSELARVAGYASDLSELFKRYRTELDLAVHGHIHASLDIVCGSTRIVANPRGRYYGPLTDGLDSLFMGYSPSADSIAQSKARFEAYPFWGDNWDFNHTSHIRIEDGLAPALATVATKDEPRLQELLAEMRELEPFAAHENPTIQRSIFESAVARGEEFTEKLAAALTRIAQAFDVESDPHPHNWWRVYDALGFSTPQGSLVPRTLFVFDDEADPRAAVVTAISAMEQVLDSLSSLPHAAELGRVRYQSLVGQAIADLTTQGHMPEWTPFTPSTVWRKLYFDLGRITVAADASTTAALSSQVDEVVNKKRIPRKAWVAVSTRLAADDEFMRPSRKGRW